MPRYPVDPRRQHLVEVLCLLYGPSMTLPLCHAYNFCWTHWASCLTCQLSSTSHWHRWQTGCQLMYTDASLCFYWYFWPPYWTKTSVHRTGFSYTCVNVIVCITCSWYVSAKVLDCSTNSMSLCSTLRDGACTFPTAITLVFSVLICSPTLASLPCSSHWLPINF